jgi:CBS domain-containing protein
MQLKEIMTTDVEVIPPDCSLKDCARKMKELNIGMLPVCDGDRILGIVTDRDLAVKGMAQENVQSVKEIMSSPPIYCFEDDEIRNAINVMNSKNIRRLIVLNRQKRLVGVASLRNAADKAGEHSHGQSQAA